MLSAFNSIQDIGEYGSIYMLIAACFNPIFSSRICQLQSDSARSGLKTNAVGLPQSL